MYIEKSQKFPIANVNVNLKFHSHTDYTKYLLQSLNVCIINKGFIFITIFKK